MTPAPHAIAEANPSAYAAATTAVAIYDATSHGRLRMLDRDRADLLHRLSTNDLRNLLPGSGLRTVLVNHNARIIDLLTVYALPEHLLVVTSPGQGSAVAQLLQRNIFFKDRVQIEPITDETVQWELYGPSADQLIHQAAGLDVAAWPLHHIQACTIGGAMGWVARTQPLGGQGFAIFAPRNDWPAMQAAFDAIPVLDAATYDVLRVEAGYPGWGTELGLDYIPLETRLVDAVSFTKGCYVGQEIIARMESRKRLAKQLMVLRPHGDLASGATLLAAGKPAGTITSLVRSPRDGMIGLGYVRTEHARTGAQLMSEDGIAVDVQELPGAA